MEVTIVRSSDHRLDPGAGDQHQPARADGTGTTTEDPSYVLGVDLGTSYTAAATFTPGRDPAMVGLGNRALQIPSVAFVNDDDIVVGELAEHRAFENPSRVVREYKRRLGDDVPIWVQGVPYPADLLMTSTLRWVVQQTTERMAGPPSRVALTHPATWGELKIEKLRQVAAAATGVDATILPEPVAAAICYASRTALDVGDRIVVYDLGGGTFDVCVLEKRAPGFAVVGTPDGIEGHGGSDFDDHVMQFVIRNLGFDASTVDPADSGWVELRRSCVEAKETLSADVETTVRVALGGTRAQVRITRSDFESLAADSIAEPIAVTERAVRSARLAAADVTAVVLVGGSSRIPLVSEMLSAAFDVPIARNTHPKHDIALGAALAAGGGGAVDHDAPPADDDPLDVAPGPVRDDEPRGSRRAGPARRRRWWPAAAVAAVVALVTTVVIVVTSGGADPLADGDDPPTSAPSTSAATTPPSAPGSDETPATEPDTSTPSTATTTTTTPATVPDVLSSFPGPPPGLPPRIDPASVQYFWLMCRGVKNIETIRQKVVGQSTPAQIIDAYREVASMAAETARQMRFLEPDYLRRYTTNTEKAPAWFGEAADLFDRAADEVGVLRPAEAAEGVSRIEAGLNAFYVSFVTVDPTDSTEGEKAYLDAVCR